MLYDTKRKAFSNTFDHELRESSGQFMDRYSIESSAIQSFSLDSNVRVHI